MKIPTPSTPLAALFLLAAAISTAHPHFRKTVIATLPDLEAKLEYTTYPWNPAHLSDVKEGFLFHCGNARLELSHSAKLGSKEIASGKYQVRARAVDLDHWTLLLIPAPADRNTPADPANAIELKTITMTGRPVYDHLSLDIAAGHGETDGKAIIVVAWGDRQLEGELAEFAAPKR